MMQVIVNQRRQQVVSKADGMEIAGKMQIDIFHGNNLRHAAAGGAAFHSETRPQ